jgi:ribosomal protein L17
MNRREFLSAATVAAACGNRLWAGADDDALDVWQRNTDLVKPDSYRQYMSDGNTRNLVSLENLERAFEKALAEARNAKIGAVPGVWSIYNMGYLVKTREAFFAIDLVHRRGPELAGELDFALVTHNHSDHSDIGLYRRMNAMHKTVISNFLDNYGAHFANRSGGFTRAEKVFKIKDCEVRTSLVDHNGYLIDFTTAFEIRVGDWILYHSGDCGHAGKLKTVWGRPDVWTFFPGCGVDVADAVRRVRPKHLVFGHLWELAHGSGRLTAPLIRAARKQATDAGCVPTVALWGERIS